MMTLLIGLSGYQLGRRGYGWRSVLLLCLWAFPLLALGFGFEPKPSLNFRQHVETIITGSLAVALLTAPAAVVSYVVGRWLSSVFGAKDKYSLFPKP